jgi:SynChlorMet cassette radical SAM/SPASM protein ScmF
MKINSLPPDKTGTATRYPLTSLYLYLADRCNLRCGHCWISPSDESADTTWIDLAALKRVIEEAIPLGLASVKLTGGEPLLYPDWKLLVSTSVDRGLGVVLETNGTLIDAATAEFLKQTNTFVSVSLDASDHKLHDRLRGVPGAYDRTLRGMDCLAKQGIAYQIIMTLQKQNRDHIPALLELADRFQAGSLKINPLIPCGRSAAIFDRGDNLSVAELRRLYAQTRRRAEAYSGLRVFFDLPPALLSVEDITGSGLSVCRILNILGILANGDISICGIGQNHSELRMGNISEDAINTVWQSHPLLEKLRDALPKRLQPPCDNCIFQFQCLGGCRALAFACDDDLLAPFFICREVYAAGLFPGSRLIHV